MNATAVDHPGDAFTPTQQTTAAENGWAARENAGRLQVADHVVEKVAGYAVTSVPGAAAAPTRLLGLNVGGARPADAASVTAEVQDGVASVHATIAVRWPMSVPAVADQVRQRVRAELMSQTGVQVAHVDIDVVSMTFPESATPRVR